MDEISWSASIWAAVRRVEAFWCQLPTYREVEAGYHLVRAVSIDGHKVAILVNTESARDSYDNPVILTQLSYLGEAIIEERAKEMVA